MLAFLRFWGVILVMYWSVAIMSLSYRIQWLTVLQPRRDLFDWANFMMDFTRTRVVRVGDRKLSRVAPKMVYLCNHRSWADFFVDLYLSEGRTQFLSRMAVAYTFPLFVLSCHILGGVLLFNRKGVSDKEKLNRWIDRRLDASPARSIMVYPEGTRSRKAESKPLKRGMLAYAFSRKLPVQIIISKGKEIVLGDEKSMHATFGHTVQVGYSETLFPTDFASVEAFVERIHRVWDSEWQRVFSASPEEGTPEDKTKEARYHTFKTSMMVQQFFACCLSIVLFYFTIWALWALLRGALSLIRVALPQWTSLRPFTVYACVLCLVLVRGVVANFIPVPTAAVGSDRCAESQSRAAGDGAVSEAGAGEGRVAEGNGKEAVGVEGGEKGAEGEGEGEGVGKRGGEQVGMGEQNGGAVAVHS